PFGNTAFRVLHLRPLGQLSVYVIPHFFQKLLERTDGKNNKIFNFRTGENPRIYGLFKRSKQPALQKISSQPRYDHFDTSPCMSTRQGGIDANIQLCQNSRRNSGLCAGRTIFKKRTELNARRTQANQPNNNITVFPFCQCPPR
ncbi:MAG: hypothetical protein PUA83_01855, partial [Clostridiales bacterium]|nr:hypothetical protein [Clostridiales bacterium]